MRRLTLLAVFLTACAHVEPTAPIPLNPTLSDARQAAFNTDFVLAHRLFASVAANAPDPKDREAAEIAMANIEWRIESNPVAARERLVRVATADALVGSSRASSSSSAGMQRPSRSREELSHSQRSRISARAHRSHSRGR